MLKWAYFLGARLLTTPRIVNNESEEGPNGCDGDVGENQIIIGNDLIHSINQLTFHLKFGFYLSG